MKSFTFRADDYRGVDLEEAQRVGSMLGLLGVLVGVPFLLLVPPTARLGVIGWTVAGVVVAGAVASSLYSRTNLSFRVGLWLAYLGVTQVALLEWLAGGWEAPYDELYLLPLVYVAGVHPARRVAAFVAVVAVLAALPLAYDGFSAAAAGTILAESLFVAGLALVIYQLMRRVRDQRLELRRRGEEAGRLARVDALTSLGNRRAFEEALEREAARSARAKTPMTLAVADLDGFKEINDRFGHIKGDECLRDAARVIDSEVRRPDACFRWGGDEFALVLPDTDRDGAELLVERLAAAMEEGCSTPDGSSVSITCGLAELEEGAGLEKLVAEADADLMRRKEKPPPARLV